MEKQVFQNVNENEKNPLKIGAVFQDGSINLTVFELETAWNTLITRLELKILADNQKIEFSEYINKLQSYIEKCPNNVEIVFKDGTLKINVLLKNNMKAVYFTTNLRKVNFSTTVFSLINKLYKEKQEHNKTLEEKQRQCDLLEKTKNEYERKLNDFIQRKEQEETELLGKFVVILNEKKQHIQHLNELLNAFRQGRPTVNEPKVIPKKQKSSKNNGNNMKNNTKIDPEKNIKVEDSKNSSAESDSNSVDDESPYNSDDEKIHSDFNKTLNKRELSPVPSTSKDAMADLFQEKKKFKSKCQEQREKSISDSDSESPRPNQRIILDTQDILDLIP